MIYTDNADIMNNTIYNCFQGIKAWGISSSVKNNVIVSCTGYGIYGLSGVDINYNNIWNNGYDYGYESTAGLNDISADPLFIDAANGDYHLSDYSPAIGDAA